jgi:hypothetical protein
VNRLNLERTRQPSSDRESANTDCGYREPDRSRRKRLVKARTISTRGLALLLPEPSERIAEPSERLAEPSERIAEPSERLAEPSELHLEPSPAPSGNHPADQDPVRLSVRPLSRAECMNSVRPCPFVSCRYHLYLEVSPKTGSLKLNFPDLEVWDLSESCSLDVADRGAQSTEQLGELLNLTPERARQLEQDALRRVASELVEQDKP